MTSSVSVIVPAHEEARVIGDVVRRIARATPDLLEVVVVDDGSTDATADEARRAGARVVSLQPNRGKGIALRAGIDAARGARLVFLDGDGQDWPEEIPDLLDALAPDVAMVIGSRFLGRFDEGAITRLNRSGTLALTAVLNVLFATRITDPIAGFRAVWAKDVADVPLRARRYDIEVDLLCALLARGKRVVEVPVRRSARRAGRTGLSPVLDGTLILARMLARRALRR